MKCIDILSGLNEIMPVELAMEWDNPGLLVGRSDKQVKKVLVALDINKDVVEDAVNEKVDLIITHHPLFFKPVYQINDFDPKTEFVLSLIKHDISYIAMHTNYDIAPGCMSDIAAEKLGIDGFPFMVTDEYNGETVGIGKAGTLDKEYTAYELAELVKSAFDIENVTVYGADTFVKTDRVAISPGSGKDMYNFALDAGCDVLITGDITHHEASEARDAGICIIDATHYGIEKIFIDDMMKILDYISDGKLKVITDFATAKGRIV